MTARLYAVRTDDPGLCRLLERNRRTWRHDALAVLDQLQDRGFPLPARVQYEDPRSSLMPDSLARDLLRTRVAPHAQIWAETDAALARRPEASYGKPYTTGQDFHGCPRYRRLPVPIGPAYIDLPADRVSWPSG